MHKNKLIIVEKVVLKQGEEYYKNLKLGIKENCKILKIDIISSLGFENTNKGFDLGIKSEEKRNNITGAYE